MALVIETGAGVRLANGYIDAAFVNSYLKDRSRSSENNWSSLSGGARADFIIAATDYIETRWGTRFKGGREFSFESEAATGSITFAGLPANDETLTLGDQIYTFKTALSVDPTVKNEVLIGADADGMASNMRDAIAADSTNVGTTFSTGTPQSRHATAVIETATPAVVDLAALADGDGGNQTTLTTAAANTAAVVFTGGLDGGSQPLSFPRLGLFDSSGRTVLGVPRKLREANAEYAVRAAGSVLAPDPTVDAQGGSIKKLLEKVGPLETETEYVEGTHLGVTLRPYPAADRLLLEYVTSAGAVR